jgi:ankyrin repeat protein
MQNSHNLEESLRETACLGDVDKVGVLVGAGVDINSQNGVNGWTALHWAAKRSHKHVVSFLLQSGANPTIRSHKNELAANVTQSEKIKRLLSGEESESVQDNGSTDRLSEACPGKQ